MNFRRHKQPNSTEKSLAKNMASNPFGYSDDESEPRETQFLIFADEDGIAFTDEDGIAFGADTEV